MLALPALLIRIATRGRVVQPDDLAERDVALVLGANTHPDGTLSRFLAARLDLAMRLYRMGKVRTLLLSGADTPSSNYETRNMRRYLEAHGIPSGDIIEDPAGFDTYDSCVRAREVFGLDSVTIVSQSFHLPRAIAICRVIGLDAQAVGDESVKSLRREWWTVSLREYAANFKMIRDLLIRRQPAGLH